MSAREIDPPPRSEDSIQRQETGLAHVASLAFVAARTVPPIGFPVSLGGGTAIARATEHLGGLRGLATGAAAAIESIAILGPARLSGPAGQLATAPLIGELVRRGRGTAVQIGAVAIARMIFNLFGTAFFILVIAGSVETFTGSYEGTVGRIPGAPQGTLAAFVGTAIGLVIWAAGASWLQVKVYARARRRWTGSADPLQALAADEPSASPAPSVEAGAAGPETPLAKRLPLDQLELAPEPTGGRFDPRAVVAAATVAFALLLASTDPVLLGAVSGWLVVAWLLSPAERSVWQAGLVLTVTLTLSSLVVNLIGEEAIGQATERACRVGLLVAVATWMRGAAGADGFRAVARRLLVRLRRFRIATELQVTLDSLAGDRRMGEAIRSLVAKVRAVDGENLWDLVDEVLDWIAAEASRFRTGPSPDPPRLAYRPIDGAIVVAAALPFLALAT